MFFTAKGQGQIPTGSFLPENICDLIFKQIKIMCIRYYLYGFCFK